MSLNIDSSLRCAIAALSSQDLEEGSGVLEKKAEAVFIKDAIQRSTQRSVDSPLEQTCEPEQKDSVWTKIVNWFWSAEKTEDTTPSFWKRLVTWFWGEVKTEEITKEQTKEDSVSPIPYEPVLETPEITDIDLSAIQNTKNARLQKVSIRSIDEIIGALSEKSVHAIINIVLNAQLEMEKESALAADKTMTTFEAFRSLKERTLEAIKDAILKDQNWAEKLKTPTQLAAAAVFISGAAAAAVTFGLATPIALSVGSIFGPAVAGLFHGSLHTLTTAAPVFAAVFASFKGVNAYQQLKIDDETAQIIVTGHEEKFYTRLFNESLKNVSDLSERESFYQEWRAKFLDRHRSLIRLLSQMLLQK